MKQILNDLAAHLESLREDGVVTVDVSRETLQGLAPPAGAPAKGPDRTAFRARSQAPQAAPAGVAGLPGPRSAPDLDAIARRVAACTRCALHKGRTHTVPGQGNPRPEVLFVGEGPGAEEDAQGLAFVGKAGQLLTKMIEAMGYSRAEVFIANIVKCRPPDNRKPFPDEMSACLPYLKEQIDILKPKVIVALGATAATGLLGATAGITKLRGNWRSFQGIDVMPTFHPSYLLRLPSAKHEAWEDLQAVLKKLGRPVPPPGKR